jgi:lipoprotein-releasing system permease protein
MSVGLELQLARRYLIGIRRRTHVATVTLISFLGLALGVVALIVTLALLEGFQASIRGELEARAVHARVSPERGRRLNHSDRLVSVLQERLPGVEMVAVTRGTCLVESLTDAVPASVVGRSDADRVAVDHVLSARIGVGVGDTVHVMSPRQRLTPMGPLPVRLRLEVADVIREAPGQETGTLILPLERSQQLLWAAPVVEALEIRDPADPWRVGQRVSAVVAEVGDEVRVEGLAELHRHLLLALTLERVMIFFAVGLMLVVAALNLLCNVAMVAAEKRRDLAVLAGLGLTPSSLRRLFVALGLSVGVVAAAVGTAVGVSAAVVLDRTRALPLPRGVFAASAVPFRVDPVAVLVVVAVALALAAAAAWLPARLVARREPAQGLRYE